ncbi:hypothetical protein [Burkholderia gladioli]|uniref:hypothetical protein n=1 Tax=Burkholderia gladioli TaxID=28095 RepID=UPI001641FF6F|nr:hypothetical protein [Burkholderia gladioli]
MPLSEEQQQQIAHLDLFKGVLNNWRVRKDPKDRTAINQAKPVIRQVLIEVGAFKVYTLSPPPGVGGLIRSNVDLLDLIFDPPWGQSVIPTVIDMIDEAVGMIQAGIVGKKRAVPPRNAAKDPEKVQMQAQIQRGYAFVVMAIDPADPALVDVLDSIKEASTRCGIVAERIDEAQGNERITDRILESIRRAEFIIVDVTHPKPNVFYEAGYAHGIGKLPIYIARQGTALQFDLKDYPTIFFQNMKSLKDSLEARLRALGKKRHA